jgi:tetratricopeptide (TPR) repeat protein
MTENHERLYHRLLALTGLGLFLGGLLLALSFVTAGLAVFAALLVVNLTAGGLLLLRRARIGAGLGRLPVSAARAVEGLRRRPANLDVRRRAGRLGSRARETSVRAPDRANALLARALQSYALTANRLSIRTRKLLGAASRPANTLARARPLKGRGRQALRLNERGAQLRRNGDHERAIEQHLVALAIVRDLGDEQAEALTLNNLALALAQGGAEAEAVQHLEQALTVLRELGDEKHEARVMANLGMVHRRQGHSEEAVNLLHEALVRLPPESPAYRQIEAELRRAS